MNLHEIIWHITTSRQFPTLFPYFYKLHGFPIPEELHLCWSSAHCRTESFLLQQRKPSERWTERHHVKNHQHPAIEVDKSDKVWPYCTIDLQTLELDSKPPLNFELFSEVSLPGMPFFACVYHAVIQGAVVLEELRWCQAKGLPLEKHWPKTPCHVTTVFHSSSFFHSFTTMWPCDPFCDNGGLGHTHLSHWFAFLRTLLCRQALANWRPLSSFEGNHWKNMPIGSA